MLGGQDLGARSPWRGLSPHQGARTRDSVHSAAAAPQGGVTGFPYPWEQSLSYRAVPPALC